MKKELMAVGFADLNKFAKVVSSIGDEKSFTLLNKAINVAGEVITKNGGRIRKYIGDAILFSLSDPSVSKKVAEELTTKFNEKVNDLDIYYRVGIATGEVMIVELGHSSFIVEDILGETVNKAAFQEQEAANSPKRYTLCEVTKTYINES